MDSHKNLNYNLKIKLEKEHSSFTSTIIPVNQTKDELKDIEIENDEILKKQTQLINEKLKKAHKTAINIELYREVNNINY